MFFLLTSLSVCAGGGVGGAQLLQEKVFVFPEGCRRQLIERNGEIFSTWLSPEGGGIVRNKSDLSHTWACSCDNGRLTVGAATVGCRLAFACNRRLRGAAVTSPDRNNVIITITVIVWQHCYFCLKQVQPARSHTSRHWSLILNRIQQSGCENADREDRASERLTLASFGVSLTGPPPS